MAEIGKPLRIIEVEPLRRPVEEPERETVPPPPKRKEQPEREPEKVPA